MPYDLEAREKRAQLLIQKETALALIPASDIRKVANYDVEAVFEKNEEINIKFLRIKDV